FPSPVPAGVRALRIAVAPFRFRGLPTDPHLCAHRLSVLALQWAMPPSGGRERRSGGARRKTRGPHRRSSGRDRLTRGPTAVWQRPHEEPEGHAAPLEGTTALQWAHPENQRGGRESRPLVSPRSFSEANFA